MKDEIAKKSNEIRETYQDLHASKSIGSLIPVEKTLELLSTKFTNLGGVESEIAYYQELNKQTKNTLNETNERLVQNLIGDKGHRWANNIVRQKQASTFSQKNKSPAF